MLRVRGIILDLCPQAANVDGDRSRVELAAVPPHAVHQFLAGEHAAPVRGEEPEEVELLQGELQPLAALARLMCERVDLDVSEGDRARLAVAAAAGAAKEVADTHRELARRERL